MEHVVSPWPRHGRSVDPAQLTGEVVQIGTIASVDYDAGTCTITIGDLTTGDLPWAAMRAGAVRIWASPMTTAETSSPSPERAADQAEEVMTETSLSKRSIYRGIKAGTFPANCQISPRRVAWSEADIEAWNNGRFPFPN